MNAVWRLLGLAQTGAWTQALAQANPVPAVLFLHGDLGAGKTTLSQALMAALGYTDRVRSPTYTLIEPYDTPEGQVLHLDLYRLAEGEELEYLGLRDYLDQPALWLVEWPERGEAYLPTPDLRLFLAIEAGGAAHTLAAQPCSARGRSLMAAVQAAFPDNGAVAS